MMNLGRARQEPCDLLHIRDEIRGRAKTSFPRPPFGAEPWQPRTLTRGPASLSSATEQWIVPSKKGPIWGGHRAVFGGFRMDEQIPLVGRSSHGCTGTGDHGLGISPPCRHHSSRRGCRTGVCGTSSRCGGGFAKQVAGNVEKGEASTFLREHLGILLRHHGVGQSFTAHGDCGLPLLSR